MRLAEDHAPDLALADSALGAGETAIPVAIVAAVFTHRGPGQPALVLDTVIASE